MNPLDLLNPLFSFLACLVKWALLSLLAILIWLLNALIAGLMGLLNPLFQLLPEISLGEADMPSWFAGVAWFFPLDFFIALSLLIIGVLVVWRVVAIGLRWLKVV